MIANKSAIGLRITHLALMALTILLTAGCTSNSNNTTNNCPAGVCGDGNKGNTNNGGPGRGTPSSGPSGSGTPSSAPSSGSKSGGTPGSEGPPGGNKASPADGRKILKYYDLAIPHGHYVDLDGQAINNQSSGADDIYFFSGFVNFPAPVEMGIIENANIDYCSTRSQRVPRGEALDLRSVKTTQSICVRTGAGRWAVARVVDSEGLYDDVVAGGSIILRVGFP